MNSDNPMTISDNNAFLMAMGEGSRIEIHAADRDKDGWTQLDSTAEAGSNQLILQDDAGWEVGDKIAISSTELDWQQSEEFTILSISEDGKTITLDGELAHTHRGVVEQYNNGKDPSDPDYLEWDVEVQAEVSLLSRNVTIQGDADSVDDGFGGHTMVMDGASQHIEGVEYFRMGQAGILGRYPVHWHELGDVGEGQYVDNVSIHHTYQKGVTIHDTNNVRVEDTVIYDHFGHGLFLEDGTETGNLILGNLVFNTRRASNGEGSIPTDATKTSSFWIENPENVFIGNHAAGSQADGYWLFEPGATTLSDIIFQDNVAHSSTANPLGISGFIQSNQNFRESQFNGDYAIIEDFTAWENRGTIWAHSTNVVYDGLELYDTRLFTMGENTFIDMLIAKDDGTGGVGHAITMYRRAGGNEFDGLHLEGFNGLQIDTVGSDLLRQPHVFVNYTDDQARTLIRIDQTKANTGNGHKLLDLDGSITGTPGGYLVPNGQGATGLMQIPDDGRYSRNLVESYISPTNIGTLTITDGNSARSSVLISRHDGLSGVLGDNDRGSVIHQPVADTQDYAFLLEFPQEKAQLKFELMDLRKGDSAIYEVANVASFGSITGAIEASSFEEMVRLDVSSYILTGDTLVMRLVGGEPVVDPNRSIEDPAQDYRAQAIVEIEGIVPPDNPIAYGEAEFTTALLDALADQPDRAEHGPIETGEATIPRADDGFELERYESTSDTIEVSDALARWSETPIWGDAGTPGADDIVVIGPGETVVLDQSTTVKGIIVNGGELIIEDSSDLTIDLSTDYLLVINGGLFQAGTEDDPLDTDFTLTLEGDDPDFDLAVTQILMGNVENTVFADASAKPDPEPEPDPVAEQTAVHIDTLTVVQNSETVWHSVTFDDIIENAVVVMGPVSANGGQPAMPRVRNVTETGFEFQIAEWDYLDGSHYPVEVSWMAASEGDYILEDGRKVSFGRTVASDDEVVDIDLTGFEGSPIVSAQVASDNGHQSVTTRVSDVTETGFSVNMQEQEASNQLHAEETVHWMAIEEGEGALSAVRIVADFEWTDTDLTAPQHLLADMQSINDADVALLRFDEDQDGDLLLRIQEDKSLDEEIVHAAEDIGAIYAQQDLVLLNIA